MKKKTIQKHKISRDCWNLDQSFYLWLNSHLPVYLKEASKVVDLTFNTYSIDNKTYTQEEIIKMMIKDVNFLIHNDWFTNNYKDVEEHLLKCWTTVLPAMWW